MDPVLTNQNAIYLQAESRAPDTENSSINDWQLEMIRIPKEVRGEYIGDSHSNNMNFNWNRKALPYLYKKWAFFKITIS